MPDDQKTNSPLSDYERRSLVASQLDRLRDLCARLYAELDTTAKRLERARNKVGRLEERERLLRAALAGLGPVIDQLHLKSVRSCRSKNP